MADSLKIIDSIVTGYKSGKTIDELANSVKMSKEYVENTLFRKGVIKRETKKEVKKDSK